MSGTQRGQLCAEPPPANGSRTDSPLLTPSASLPDRESEVSRVALAGPSQKAAMDPPGQEQLLCLDATDVGMKPPAKCKCDM